MPRLSDPVEHSPPALSAEERASLVRVLASDAITKAPRMEEVLRYLIDAFLEGRIDELSEQNIGQAVFGRPVGYNASDDNIVRVTMRHLRTRLEEFYKTEGLDEEYILEIPKGKYVPCIVRRERQTPAPLSSLAESSRAPEKPEPTPVRTDKLNFSPRLKWTWLLLAVLFFSTLVLGTLLIRASNSSKSNRDQCLLTLLVPPGGRINVVVTDSNLQAYREILGKQVALDSYIDRSYTRPEANSTAVPPGAWEFLDATSDTSLTSAIVASSIQAAAGSFPVTIEHPHDLSMRDFQEGSLIILLGGPWINPWGQLFEHQLNFRITPRESNHATSEIQNLNPQPNEAKVFEPHGQGPIMLNYVRVAVLPNLAGRGRVILLGATSPEALEAGGRFLLTRDALDDVARRFNTSPGKLPSFEVVLEVEGAQTVPGTMRVVAQRIIPVP